MNKISVVISTKDRSGSLKRTLESVAPLADEIIVVDNESSDDTVTIAKKFTKKVYRRQNNLMLNVNKNFGFTKASGDWILCLDDDEVLTDTLIGEIRTAVHDADSATPPTDGFWIPRKNIIFGKWITHGLWWPDRQLRLFRKGAGKFPEKHVHEYVEVSGPTGTLTEPYMHYNYDSIDQFLQKMQTIYCVSEVANLTASGYVVRWYDAIRFPASDFLKVYFAQEGYKDGLHGLVLALLQSFYSFIVFAKLWEKERFVPQDIRLGTAVAELDRTAKDFRYWILSAKIAGTRDPLTKLWNRLLRKMR